MQSLIQNLKTPSSNTSIFSRANNTLSKPVFSFSPNSSTNSSFNPLSPTSTISNTIGSFSPESSMKLKISSWLLFVISIIFALLFA